MHERGAGESAGFGAHYVHDVLEPLASVATDDPEPEFALPAGRQVS